MTDRFNGLVVTLERDIREDDAQSLIDAIKHLRGVVEVRGMVTDPQAHVERMRANAAVGQKLIELGTELLRGS